MHHNIPSFFCFLCKCSKKKLELLPASLCETRSLISSFPTFQSCVKIYFTVADCQIVQTHSRPACCCSANSPIIHTPISTRNLHWWLHVVRSPHTVIFRGKCMHTVFSELLGGRRKKNREGVEIRTGGESVWETWGRKTTDTCSWNPTWFLHHIPAEFSRLSCSDSGCGGHAQSPTLNYTADSVTVWVKWLLYGRYICILWKADTTVDVIVTVFKLTIITH